MTKFRQTTNPVHTGHRASQGGDKEEGQGERRGEEEGLEEGAKLGRGGGKRWDSRRREGGGNGAEKPAEAKSGS